MNFSFGEVDGIIHVTATVTQNTEVIASKVLKEETQIFVDNVSKADAKAGQVLKEDTQIFVNNVSKADVKTNVGWLGPYSKYQSNFK